MSIVDTNSVIRAYLAAQTTLTAITIGNAFSESLSSAGMD